MTTKDLIKWLKLAEDKYHEQHRMTIGQAVIATKPKSASVAEAELVLNIATSIPLDKANEWYNSFVQLEQQQ